MEVFMPCQMFLGTLDKVYFIDKVENNPAQINGHPAWASGAPHIFKSECFKFNHLIFRVGFGK
jgi:hypothetical protein